MTSCESGFGVIFDFDGVLVDSGWAHRQAWFDLAEKEGLEMSDAFFEATFGMQNDTILPMLKPGIAEPEMESLGDWKERRYRDLVQSRSELADGAPELLAELKGNGFRVAIGSSAPRANIDVFWETQELSRYIDVCVTKEQVVEGKPAPETFLKAAQQLGLEPTCCTVVEDAIHGVEAGQAARMPVVAVTTTRTRAELSQAQHVVDSLAELTAGDFRGLMTQVD